MFTARNSKYASDAERQEKLSFFKKLSFLNIWQGIARTLSEAVFPSRCLVCEEFFPPPPKIEIRDIEDITFETAMGAFICRNCCCGFVPIEPPICLWCGIEIENYEDEICVRCHNTLNQFRKARMLGFYRTPKSDDDLEEQPLEKAIKALKYSEKTWLAKGLGMLLFSTFVRYWDPKEIDLVMPVPLHIRKLRKRGFNQSYLLVINWHRIAEKLNINLSHIQIDIDTLIRHKDTKPQVSLEGKEERKRNIEKAFRVINPSKIQGKRILLVDDVFTSGSTVNECAKALLKAGAECVDVLALARPLKKK
jgi:ComF family protein